MDTSQKISKMAQVLQALILLSLGIFVVLGMLYWSAFQGGRSLTALDPATLPEGPWKGEAPLFQYYDNGGVLTVAREGALSYVVFRSTAEGSKDYNGLGVLGTYSIPPEAELELKWRCWGTAGGIDLHLIDSPPAGAKQTRGEDFQFTTAAPDHRWEVAHIPLSRFQPNTYQEANVYVDGILNTRPLQSIEIGLHQGAVVRLDLASIRLVWKANLVPLYVYLGGLAVFTLILWIRTTGRILPYGGSTSDLVSVVQSRIGFLLGSAAFLAACWGSPEFGNSPAALITFGFLFLLIVVEDYLPSHRLKQRWMLFRYLIPGALVLAFVPPLNYTAFSLLFLLMVLPAILARDRSSFSVLLLVSAALLGLHPARDVPDFLVFHWLTMAAVSLTVYGIVEFWLLKDHRLEIDRALMLYQGVFSWSSDAIYTLDAAGKLTNVNRAFETLTGLERTQIIGQDIQNFITAPRDISASGQRFSAQLKGPLDRRLEVLVSEHPIQEGKRIVGYQGIATDYTERKRLEEELRETNQKLEALVHQDGLTGVNNRRYFDSQVRIEWRRCLRARVPLSLILIDIDHFKLYNDRYGHQAGDDCLTRVAQGLRDNLKRAGDLAARYGGEEFVILLPSTDGASAEKVAAYLQAAITRLALPHEASLTAPVVTISMGIATLPPEEDPGHTPEALLAAADQALYRAKKAGRNRFERAEPRPGTPA